MAESSPSLLPSTRTAWSTDVLRRKWRSTRPINSSGKACLNCSASSASTPRAKTLKRATYWCPASVKRAPPPPGPPDMAFYERHTQALFHFLHPIPCPVILRLHPLGSGVDRTGRLDGFEQLHTPQAENNPTISLNPEIRVRSDRRGHRCPWKRGKLSEESRDNPQQTASSQRPAITLNPLSASLAVKRKSIITR